MMKHTTDKTVVDTLRRMLLKPAYPTLPARNAHVDDDGNLRYAAYDETGTLRHYCLQVYEVLP